MSEQKSNTFSFDPTMHFQRIRQMAHQAHHALPIQFHRPTKPTIPHIAWSLTSQYLTLVVAQYLEHGHQREQRPYK